MARLIKKRGKTNLTGLAGDIEFFTINGETYFKTHSKKHRKSKSKEAVSGRNNFASVVDLAKSIIRDADLKEIWNLSSSKGRNGYQRLIKYNMPLAYEGNLTIKNFMTPKGCKLFIPEFPIEDNTLNFTFDIYGLIKPPLTLHMFYYFYNRKSKLSPVFLSVYDKIDIDGDNVDLLRKKGESKFTIKSRMNKDVIRDKSFFNDMVLLFAVTGTPTIAKRKSWTSTVGFDIPLI